MITLVEKISYLESFLSQPEINYSDSFKTDILFFIDDFNTSNTKLSFLNNFDTYIEIEDWVNKLTSRIVLKFQEESEQIQDFIYDFIKNG
jgi:hypothetical protein